MDELLQWEIFRLLNRHQLETIRLAHVWAWAHGQSAIYVDQNDDVRKLKMDKDYKLTSIEYKILSGKRIVSFDSGHEHTVALTRDGKLYGYGKNTHGQLGDKTNVDRSSFVLCSEFGPYTLTQVTVSRRRTFGLTDSGQMVWCGYNTDGVQASKIRNITSIQAGSGPNTTPNSSSDCVLCLCKDGQVYEMTDTQMELRLVPDLPVIVQIARGARFSLVLTERGKILSWGENSNGELGNGKVGNGRIRTTNDAIFGFGEPLINDKRPSPVNVPNSLRFVDLATHGMSRTIAARAVNGKIYMWGECNGRLVPTPMETALTRLDTVFSMVDRPLRCLRSIKVVQDRPLALALFNQPCVSDCTFLVEGRPIYATKSLLKLRLEYFNIMFNGDWKETLGAVNITGYGYTTYFTFLRFLYTGDVQHIATQDKVETLLDLLRLAHEVQYDVLIENCAACLQSKLTYENVCEVYSVAKTLNVTSLVNACCRLARTDVLTVFRSEAYAKMPQDARNEFTFCAVENPYVKDGPGCSTEGVKSEPMNEYATELECKRQRLEDD